MMTRSAQVHCLNGSVCKLHFSEKLTDRYRYPKPTKEGEAFVHTVRTTRGRVIARVVDINGTDSPWFELANETEGAVTAFMNSWTNGNLLSDLMLR